MPFENPKPSGFIATREFLARAFTRLPGEFPPDQVKIVEPQDVTDDEVLAYLLKGTPTVNNFRGSNAEMRLKEPSIPQCNLKPGVREGSDETMTQRGEALSFENILTQSEK